MTNEFFISVVGELFYKNLSNFFTLLTLIYMISHMHARTPFRYGWTLGKISRYKGMRINCMYAILLQIRDKKVKVAGVVAARLPAAYSKSS